MAAISYLYDRQRQLNDKAYSLTSPHPTMDYQQYFDDLSIDISLDDAKNVIDIMEKQADNPEVAEYDGMQEMVFELMMALWSDNDFAGLESFGNLLKERYAEIYEQEKGQLLSILMEWHLRQGEVERAAEAWREWYNSKYDYDMILQGLDLLILYNQSSLVDEFINKEYQKVRDSPRLIQGAEYELQIYKLYNEIGKLIDGKSTLENLNAELQTVDLKRNPDVDALLSDREATLPVKLFSTSRIKFVKGVMYRAQKFIQQRHLIPFISSTYLLDIYFDLLAKSKSNNYAAYFKVSEEKLTQHLQGHAGERMLGAQDALALVHLLPVLFEALVEQGIFTQADADKESAKAGLVFKQLARKFPKDVERAGHLRLYPGFGG